MHSLENATVVILQSQWMFRMDQMVVCKPAMPDSVSKRSNKNCVHFGDIYLLVYRTIMQDIN
jgi:hypothetical protein